MGKRKTSLFDGLDWVTWALVVYCLFDIGKGMYVDGWDTFWKAVFANPLMGGTPGPVARGLDLPLYSYQVGHIVPGISISFLGVAVLYYIAKEYKYADRDDLRSSLVTILAIVGSAPVVAPLHKQVSEGRVGLMYFDINERPLYYIPLCLFGSFVITETWFYWFHYLGHKSEWVWRHIHELHHTFIPSTATCASAFHPLDIFGLTIGGFLAVLVLPIHFGAQNGLLLLNLIWGIYQHSAWRSRLPSPLRFVFNDSMSHTIHHDMGRAPRNLGSLSCLWDRFMGTYQDDPPKWAQLRATAYQE